MNSGSQGKEVVRKQIPPAPEYVEATIADDGAGGGVHIARLRLRFDIASGKGAETYNDAEKESGCERTREIHYEREGSVRRQRGSDRNRYGIDRPSCEKYKQQ